MELKQQHLDDAARYLTTDIIIGRIQELEAGCQVYQYYATGMQSPDITEEQMERAQAKQSHMEQCLLALYREYHRRKIQQLHQDNQPPTS
jgi:hypothetical protein